MVLFQDRSLSSQCLTMRESVCLTRWTKRTTLSIKPCRLADQACISTSEAWRRPGQTSELKIVDNLVVGLLRIQRDKQVATPSGGIGGAAS
jgi:hypothetical protein